jgi:aryl-phospho-beta-D-glucosidase BglC (GH1 family)
MIRLRFLVTTCVIALSATPLAAQKAEPAGCATQAPGAVRPTSPPPLVRGFNISGIGQNQIPDAHKWGVNAIRLQIFPRNRAMQWHKSLWEAWPIVLDTLVVAVKQAAANHMKVIVDLHEPPIPDVREGQPELWNHPDLAQSFCRAWADIARRLLPYRSTIWGYDLYNEPYDRSQLPRAPRQWRSLAVQIISTIRTIDRETWIVYEPGPGGTFGGLEGLQPLPDSRVVYSAHIYDPVDFTAQGAAGHPSAGAVHYGKINSGQQWTVAAIDRAVTPAVRFQARHHVPIFIGEFSVDRWAPHEDAVRWLNDAIDVFERHRWSWAYHIFRDWNGWSLEHDDSPEPDPKPVSYLTDRGKVIKEGLARNRGR